MTFVVPASADLVARFPGFGGVDPPRITAAIAEARTRVDGTWLPDDGPVAILLLAAHILTLDGQGTGAEAASAAAGALGFQVMRSGPLELERTTRGPDGARSSTLADTTYGRRFLTMLKVNQPPVLVV